jgi:hypothetical protein
MKLEMPVVKLKLLLTLQQTEASFAPSKFIPKREKLLESSHLSGTYDIYWLLIPDAIVAGHPC